MPQRVGYFPGGVGQRIASGAFGGLSEAADTISRDYLRRATEQHALIRELIKDYSDRVANGTMEPEQAEAALTLQGAKVPKGYFDAVQPSTNFETRKIVEKLKPTTTEGELNAAMPKRIAPIVQPTIGGATPEASAPFFDTSQGPAIDQMDPNTEKINQALQSIRQMALGQQKPEQIARYDPTEGRNVMDFTKFDPYHGGQPFTVGSPITKGPTGAESGRTEGEKNLAQAFTESLGNLGKLRGRAAGEQSTSQAETELSGGLGTTQGNIAGQKLQAETPFQITSKNLIEAGTRGEHLKTVRGEATTRLEAESTPWAIAVKAKQVAANETARQQAIDAGVPPGIAALYTFGTLTNRAYLHFPNGTPKEDIATVIRRTASNPALRGIKIVNEHQAEALAGIQAARANYDTIMGRFQGHLAKDAAGRPLSMVKNKLGIYLKSDPELAGIVATAFPLVISNLKAVAGNVGRIMKAEIEQMSESIPTPDDTWASAQSKKLSMGLHFANAEDSILGVQTAPTQR